MMFHRYDGDYSVSYTFADGGELRVIYFTGNVFFCSSQSTITDSESSSLATELRCSGLDWYEFGDFCYKPFGDKKTWYDARKACRNVGADLMSILSMTEQSWVESYLYMGRDSGKHFLGNAFQNKSNFRQCHCTK